MDRAGRLTTLTASFVVGACTIALTGCGGSSPVVGDPVGGGGGGGGGRPTFSNSVSVHDGHFTPAFVSVAAGEVMVWDWKGSEEHNVTWVDGHLIDSPTQADGSHEVRMPFQAGSYGYYCSIHGAPSSGMRGTVVVD